MFNKFSNFSSLFCYRFIEVEVIYFKNKMTLLIDCFIVKRIIGHYKLLFYKFKILLSMFTWLMILNQIKLNFGRMGYCFSLGFSVISVYKLFCFYYNFEYKFKIFCMLNGKIKIIFLLDISVSGYFRIFLDLKYCFTLYILLLLRNRMF